MKEESELRNYPLLEEDIQKLKEKFEKNLTENPLSSDFVFLGEILRKQDELDKAIEVLIKGLKNNPHNITARFILGKIYYERWMIDEAKKEMEEVIKHAPDNVNAGKILIQIYISEGRLDQALHLALSTLVFHPEDNELIETVEEIKKEILMYRKDKDSMEAQNPESLSEEDFEFVDTEIYTETMADLYLEQQLYERAIKILEKLLETYPENDNIRMKLEQARTYLQESKKSEE
ncbi:MAG: hypothetical protein KatS3mg078_0530 [Deltaproteobacteria bacterium]|jgi:tetratricopeptide (TPR) repeat protein|nr:MAG: hypothetical protein KatS3mg078_0530 [Deltaproteobacteria bacterium]